MKKLSNVLMATFAAAVITVTVGSAVSFARPPLNCPDVWIPVICSDGNIYSNFCYASQAGATGCVLWGGDDI